VRTGQACKSPSGHITLTSALTSRPALGNTIPVGGTANSISKLNLGYRFQISGNMERMGKQSFLVSYEYSFLNVWGKNKKSS